MKFEGLKYGVLDRANARLISATPDLLEAAKRALAYLEIQAEKTFNEKKGTNDKSSTEDYMAPEALLLRSAIHKAEGLIFEWRFSYFLFLACWTISFTSSRRVGA